jgi:AcrR family transcriptional regulator
MDDERRRRVRQAAMEVFLRYGYRKVTMADIARGVGVSRPALYLLFPNKEAVFRDMVQAGLDDLVERIEAGLPGRNSLAARLSHVFEVSSVGSFALVARAPAAQELMSASFDFVRDLFERHERRLAAILVRLLRDAVSRPEELEPPAPARARVMLAAAHGFKAMAKDVGEMKALVDALVRMTVAGLPVEARGSAGPRRDTRPRRRAPRPG